VDLGHVSPGADADKRAEVHRQLGLKLTYQPAEKKVIAEANASAIMYQSECPRGDLNPHALYGH
jgi:site-specific DNA recombinase